VSARLIQFSASLVTVRYSYNRMLKITVKFIGALLNRI